MENKKTNYINTVVYSSQLSDLKTNNNGHNYRFLELKAKKTLTSSEFIKNFGNVKKVSLVVPEFAIKGAKTNTVGDKLYSLEKDSENKPVAFDKLELNENREKIGGQHSIAIVSWPEPQVGDETKYKVNMSILIDEKTWESKTFEISFEKLKQLIIENTKEVSDAIKKYKDKNLASGFEEVVLHDQTTESTVEDTIKNIENTKIDKVR